MMKFITGIKVYVRYSADIALPFGEWLAIEKYENGLLYFKEQPPEAAITCNAASFYGFGYCLAGSTLVTNKKWHIPFAAIAEKIRRFLPVNSIRTIKPILSVGKFASLKTNNG